MFKVKITTTKNSDYMLQQTEGQKGVSKCGKYRFFIDEEIETPDFWVVRNKLLKSKTTCLVAPENTILMTSEPRSVVNFPKRYRDQFGLLLSSQKDIKHNNMQHTQAILPWYVGYEWKDGKPNCTKTYDEIKASPLPPKTKLISVISSSKAFSRGHQDRIRFVEKLKKHYGDKLDVFGRGINPFNDKWDVLAPYKYHIALENSSSRNYWTEKISDCYLTGTFPIYYGCKNIEDYFPKEAYRTIDDYNFESAVKTIDAVIANNEFENNQTALLKCRDLVLDDYNYFNIIAKYCDTLNPDLPKKMVTLKPAITAVDWHNFYLYFFERNYFNLKNRIYKLFYRDFL